MVLDNIGYTCILINLWILHRDFVDCAESWGRITAIDISLAGGVCANNLQHVGVGGLCMAKKIRA